MFRRSFLQSAVGAAVAGTPAAPAAVANLPSPDLGPGQILKTFTAEQHRRRLQNIAACEKGIRKCMRKHLITTYIPGQAAYNLGEYPARKPYNPDEYDEQELDRLRGLGVRLVQVMEDWNDMMRLFGGDKFTAVN